MSESKQFVTVFPTKLIVTLISAISLALILSAGHSFITLHELRTQYLENLAGDLARTISQVAGGRGRRSSTLLWEQAIGEIYEERRDSLRFIVLTDRDDEVLAQVGFDAATAPADLDGVEQRISSGDYLYLYEMSGPIGGGPWWEANRVPVSKIALGLDAAGADFLVRQAYIHLVVSAAALIALWGLSFYLIRTLRQFLLLKVREESERHLTSLGRMSATLAHEIRNPLGAMKGLTQVAREELPPEHSTQEMLKTVVDEAHRLEGLVTDLLSFARVRKLELSEFDLATLTEEVVALLSREAGEAGVAVSVRSGSGKVRVHSDRDGLKQVLLNVIKNAIEASPPGGQILVELEANSERTAVIEVKDQGQGIGKSDPEELFEPFKTTKTRGSGLGLAVCRQITTQLGGRISLANNSDTGASCTIQIPRKVGQVRSRGSKSPANGQS